MVAYAYYFTDARIKAYVRSLLKIGLFVDVISLREPSRAADKENFGKLSLFYISRKYTGTNKIRYILSYINFSIRAFIKLSYLWFIRQYNIIHVHNMPDFIVLSAILPRLFGSKIIIDVHDLFSQTYLEKYGTRSVLYELIKLEEKMSFAFAHAIICADDFQADFLVKRRRINRQKLTVIMNFPDLSIFHCDYDRRLHSKNYFNVVYHGTITYRLGIDIILKAIEIIKDALPVRFFLFGSGDYLKECLQFIDQHNLHNVVFASGRFFKVEELPMLLADKHAGVIGNRSTRATQYMLPVKLLEYMAMKIPVIAPSLVNLQFYFNDSEVLFYEPENPKDLAEKIRQLYKNQDIRKKHIVRGYEYIRNNNWDREVIKYFAVIGRDDSTIYKFGE